MLHILGCITEQHDLRLVVLAGALCLFASAAAMSMIARAQIATGRLRVSWLAAAGLVAGCGIWATHFVAMLAYQAGFPVAYNLGLTVLSIVIACVLCGSGFAVALSRAGAVLGGAVIGVSIAAMHYVGMAAMRMQADPVWDFRYVALSVVAGISLAALAMAVFIRRRTLRARVTGIGIFTLAICCTHFIGMAAVTLRFDPLAAIPRDVIDPTILAAAVTAVAALVVGLGLVGSLVDRQLSTRAHEAERLRQHIDMLQAAKRELEETSSNLVAALDAAAAASRAKSAFLATMSHELRTPLNAVVGFSQVMVEEAFGPLGGSDYLECARDIHASGAHLLALINDVLDLTRLDTGQSVLAEECLDICGLIDEAMRKIAPSAAAANIELRTNIEPGLPLLNADRRRIGQVLENLLVNAVKFTPAGGRVRVDACRSGENLAMAIVDSGIGIAPEDIPKVLERFGQVDSTLARKFEGVGLGLPLAKQLMELHGGSLTLESRPGMGTTVTVSFPAGRATRGRLVA